MRRWLALLLVVAACGDEAAAVDGGTDGAIAPVDLAGIDADPSEPAPPAPPLPQAALDAISTEIGAVLARAAYTRSVRIDDVATGQVVFTDNPGGLLKPASNTKLYTTAAALEILGADHGLTTRVLSTSPVGAGGVIAGDLYVIFEHDFTASALLYDSPSVPIDRLAAALAARGIKSVSGAVRVAGEPIYGGSSIGTLDVTAHRMAMIAPLDAALTTAGITHTTPIADTTLAAPAGATPLLVREPLALIVGCSPLNVESHNEFADLLHRHLGWTQEGTSSAAAGSMAVLDWLSSTGIPATGLVFQDGSGLSHNNRTSADATIALFKLMEQQPVGPAWRRTLSIADVRGTIGARLIEEDTRGRVFAKTGTLSDTIALSGLLEHKHDGQRYLFSMMLNAVTDATLARDMVDDVVRAIAKNTRAASARLSAPRLRWARGIGAAGLGELRWTAVSGAMGYLVWRSEDGERWPVADARLYRGEGAILGQLATDAPTFVRVTALDAAGLQSDPSVTHVLTGSATTEILLVDGNDRWHDEPQAENTLRWHHGFLAPLGGALAPHSLASVDDDELNAGAFSLPGYPLVLWAAGEQSEMEGWLSQAQEDALASYLTGGGALVLSSAELVWNLSQNGADFDRTFLGGSLQAGFVADDAGSYEVIGTGPLAAVGNLSFFAPDGMDVRYPDALDVAGASVPLLDYIGGVGGHAAVGVPNKVVVTGFPIEAMPSGAQRRALLAALLGFLGR